MISPAHLDLVINSIAEGITVQDMRGNLIYVNEAAARLTGFKSAKELLSTPREKILEKYELLDEARRLIRAGRLPGRMVISSGKPQEEVIQFRILATGEKRWSTVKSRPVNDKQKKLKVIVNVFRDITREKVTQDQLIHKIRQQESVSLLGQKSLEGASSSKIMQFALEILSLRLPIEYSKIARMDDDGKSLLIIYGKGWRKGNIGTVREASDIYSPAGYTLKSRKPVIMNNLAEEKRFKIPAFLKDHGINSGMSVIIHGEQKPFGVLGVYSNSAVKFNRDDIYFLSQVSNIIAESIEGEKKVEEIKFQTKLINAVEEAVIATDPDGKVIFWNDYASKLYGWKMSEMKGKNLMKIIPDWEKNKTKFAMAAVRKSDSWSGEMQLLNKNGKVFTASVSDYPVMGNNGKLIGMVGVSRNISIEKRQEISLLFLERATAMMGSSLEYEKTLAEVCRLAVSEFCEWCVVDLWEDGKLRQLSVSHFRKSMVDKALIFQKQYPPNLNKTEGRLIIARSGKRIFIPEINKLMLKKYAMSAEQLKQLESFNFNSYIGIPIKYQEKTLGVLSFINTGGNRIFSRADLSIAQNVANRAGVAIENARLYNLAQEKISEKEEIEKRKDEFISIASHELKTPLTSIKAFTQILLKSVSDDEIKHKKYLTRMDQQLDKLTELINDLLDVSRIKSGVLELREEIFPLDIFVREVVEDVASIVPNNDIVVVGRTGRLIKSDKNRISQVLTNLLTNAGKYSPNGREILVRLDYSDKEVTIHVEDFGIGIAKNKINKIFQRFTRINNPKNEKSPGLGLGLYISSQIINRLGGELRVKSEPGKGSVFSFNLPTLKEKQLLLSYN